MSLEDRCLEAIRAIARSPAVTQYKIGFTAKPTQRTDQYLRVEYAHVVLLASELTYDAALDLEKALQAGCKGAPKSSVLHRKYDHLTREKSYQRSSGGAAADPEALRHSVYMAWWT